VDYDLEEESPLQFSPEENPDRERQSKTVFPQPMSWKDCAKRSMPDCPERYSVSSTSSSKSALEKRRPIRCGQYSRLMDAPTLGEFRKPHLLTRLTIISMPTNWRLANHRHPFIEGPVNPETVARIGRILKGKAPLKSAVLSHLRLTIQPLMVVLGN
jgi:hypothetical protein